MIISSKFLIIPIIFIMVFSFFSISYQQTGDFISISKKTSCESIGGIWDIANCSVTTLEINSGDTLHISSGLQLTSKGSINNFGTILIGTDATLVNKPGSIITNHGSGIIFNTQDSKLINEKGGTINNNQNGLLNNFLSSMIYNEGLIQNKGNITNNRSYIENIGQGSFHECSGLCYFAQPPNEGLLSNDGGGLLTNTAGTIKNTKGAIIYNKNGTIYNLDQSKIINTEGGVIPNILNAIFINDYSLIFNEGGSFLSNGRDAIFQNQLGGVILNTKGGSFFNNFDGYVENKGIIFNDGGQMSTYNGVIKNYNKIYNDCGGLVINHWEISESVINIPC